MRGEFVQKAERALQNLDRGGLLGWWFAGTHVKHF